MSDEQSIIDFLARSVEHYRANGSMMDAAMTLGVKTLIERLRAENFTLAANQCHAGYAGDHGDHMCHLLGALTDTTNVLERVSQMLARGIPPAAGLVLSLVGDVERARAVIARSLPISLPPEQDMSKRRHPDLGEIIRRAVYRELVKMQEKGTNMIGGQWGGEALASHVAPGVIRAVKAFLAPKKHKGSRP